MKVDLDIVEGRCKRSEPLAYKEDVLPLIDELREYRRNGKRSAAVSRVFMVLMNDATLSIHATEAGATAACLGIVNGDDRYKALRPGRWYMPNGPVARLEIEERHVMP